MRTTFFAQLLFFAILLWQPTVAQTSLPACTASLADDDNDGVAAAADIDKDNDGLIEICDIEGIDEMRYQLDGSGYTTSTDAIKITQGCPTTGCQGYELMRSLDFDDASAYRNGSINTDWTVNDYADDTDVGWQPIRGFASIFNGNGHIISNLQINRIGENGVGLFAAVHQLGRVENIDLVYPNVRGNSNVGGLVGNNNGVVINSYVRDYDTDATTRDTSKYIEAIEGSVGGLVGRNDGGGANIGYIVNSGAVINVQISTSTDSIGANAGGLTGFNPNGAEIRNSYARGTVKGPCGVGGLTANNFSTVPSDPERNSKIINSYATGNVITGFGNCNDAGNVRSGGLTAVNNGLISNSYTTSCFSSGSAAVASTRRGGVVQNNSGTINNSYYQTTDCKGLQQTPSGSAKTQSELQTATANSGIYQAWSLADWDFGDSSHYPALRYAQGDDLNACATEITPSSTLLPCTILLPNQRGRNQGLAGVFFFTGGEQASVVMDPLFSQGIDYYDMTIVASDLNIRPYALNDNAEIAISKGDTDYFKGDNFSNFSSNKPNGALSDAIGLDDNETTLTIVITNPLGETNVVTTYTFVIVTPLRVDINPQQLRIISEPAILDPDGGSFSYQWQQQAPRGRWTNIPNATTATYSLPADAKGSIRYRLINIKHTASDGSITDYPDQGPFRASADDDGDGLIDIYTLEDLDAIRYQRFGRAYKADQGAVPIMQGCPAAGCIGYELMQSLDFNANTSYRTTSNKAIWTTGEGWRQITRFGADVFRSVFEGNGHTISNLRINRASRGLGLFNDVGAGGEIKNVGLLDVDIEATGSFSSFVGGLTAANNGAIINSYVTGKVIGGGDNIGGLVGTNFGSIINSYVIGEIAGNGTTGGLVGWNLEGTIINSYAMGSVAGDWQIGGLVGWNFNSIISSYATGMVSGDSSVGGLIGQDFGNVTTSYWDSTVNASLTMSENAKTTTELQSPTAASGIYSDWNSHDWDFGDNSHYPALRYAKGDNLNACATEITPSSTVPCGILLPDQNGRNQGLAGVFFFADGKVAPTRQTPPLSQFGYSYDTTIITTKTAVQLTLRPYAINDDAIITITDQDNTSYFADKLNAAASDPIMLSDELVTLTLTVTDTIDGTTTDTTYTFAIKRAPPLEVNAITLSPDPAEPIDEGHTITLTFDVSGGSGRYEYAYLLDDQPLPSPSQSPFEFIPATDIVAAAATTQTVKLTIRVSDDDGQIFEHSEDLTIRKVDNGDLVIASDISPARLRIIFEQPDPDGEGEFSLQWQSQESGGEWTNIVDATTATYYLPANADSRIRYRAVNISYTDGQGYVMNYADQELFPDVTMLMGDISIEGQTNEGSTFTLTAPTVSGGSGEYNYAWTQTVEDDSQLSGHSALTLTSTTATLEVATPADFIALAAISVNITFKVIVDDGSTMTSSSKVVTINKMDNGLADIAITEVNGTLSVTVGSDPDGDATPNYAYQWQQRAPEQGSQWMNIDTATAATYSVPSDTLIDTGFRVLVTYTDGQGYRSTVASNEIAYPPLPEAIEATSDISGVGQADEGETLILTAPTVSGGSGEYNYTWTHTVEDDTQLSSHSALTLTSTTATVHVAIPVDFIASALASANITFRVVVDDGFTMTSRSKVVTIHKINNDSPALTAEVSLARLSISLVEPDMDGEGDFSLQWQSQVSEGEWMNIANATTATYHLPTAADISIRYRAVNIRYTDGQDYAMNYDDQGPFLGDTMLMGDISIEGPANEGSTFTLTAPPASGGLAVYNYEWTQTMDDSAHLSSHSALILTNTNTATLEVAIPADFIALAATSATITFKVVVDDGLSMTSRSKVVTIHKIDNGSPAITTEVSLSQLSLILVEPEADGEGNFSLQWQSQMPSGDWMDIANATTATYHLPAASNQRIRYRAIDISYTDGQGYQTAYQDQGPFPGAIEAIGDISSAAQANEGDTLTLTAPPLSGGGQYNYTWTHTVEDNTQLSGDSVLTLTGTTATVHVTIPADFIAVAATSTNITFRVVVDDGFTMTSQSKVVTIYKIDNGTDIAITKDKEILSVTVNDPDGDATTPSYAYQWQQRAPGADSQWMDIDAAIAATYSVPSDTLIDSGFRVLVTYTDGQGYRQTGQSAEIAYFPVPEGLRIRTKVFLEGPLR